MKFSYGIAAISPFSHRLAFDNMPEDLQRLRCKVNFQALTFVPHIRALGDALVSRLRYPSLRTEPEHRILQQFSYRKLSREPQKFVVLHLRFDKVCSSRVQNYVGYKHCTHFDHHSNIFYQQFNLLFRTWLLIQPVTLVVVKLKSWL